MFKERPDVAKLLLRLAIGGLMLFHGADKMLHGVAGISSMLERQGMPGFVAYGVYVGEILAPVMLIVGYRVRLAALVFAFNMVVAVGLAHPDDVLSIGKHGQWAIELQALYFMGALVIALQGAGKYAYRFQRVDKTLEVRRQSAGTAPVDA